MEYVFINRTQYISGVDGLLQTKEHSLWSLKRGKE